MLLVPFVEFCGEVVKTIPGSTGLSRFLSNFHVNYENILNFEMVHRLRNLWKSELSDPNAIGGFALVQDIANDDEFFPSCEEIAFAQNRDTSIDGIFTVALGEW